MLSFSDLTDKGTHMETYQERSRFFSFPSYLHAIIMLCAFVSIMALVVIL